MTRAVSRLQEQNRGQVARALLWLLLVSVVLVFASIWCQPDPEASVMYDVFQALSGMAGLVVWFYYGRQRSRKRAAQIRELRVEAQLRIEQRDGTPRS